MAEEQDGGQRTISGTGLFRMPESVDKPRYVSLLVDVIRRPSTIFLSKKFNPNRQRYATLVFLRSKYVIHEDYIDYEHRRFDWVTDAPGQTLIAVKCAYEGVLAYVGTLFGLQNTTTNITLPGVDFDNLNLLWDEVRVVCEGDTAVQVGLRWMPYDTCDPESNKEKKPPPPPPPPAQVPPGTGIGDISPPYDEEDDVTEPNPLDEAPDPEPEFPDCTDLTLTLEVKINGFAPFNQPYRIFAPYGGTRFVGANQTGLECNCRGVPGGTCQPESSWVAIDSAANGFEYVNFVSLVVT